uniref:Putative ferritin light-chain-like n=1 Tax=Psorophora albipes TaxID=869069 RepID=T1DEY0_9DIPT
MKFFLLTAALVAGLCTVRADYNSSDVTQFTAQYSAIAHVAQDLQSFTNQMLDKSWDFLLLSAVFNQYNLNRPGFEKLHRKVSDRAWDDCIETVKYLSQRGVSHSFNGVQNGVVSRLNAGKSGRNSLLDSDELSSLKLGLGYEKILADEVHTIHKKISHAHDKGNAYDPDVAHFLDEKYDEAQREQVREYAGHIHVLTRILEEPGTKQLGLHMFDDILAK